MDDRAPSARRWGRASLIGGALAVLLPIAGWLSAYLAITLTSSGDAIGLGLVTSAALGVLGLIAWIAGLVASIRGMAASGGDDRRLVLAGAVLSVVAPIACFAEWAFVTTQFQFMQF